MVRTPSIFTQHTFIALCLWHYKKLVLYLLGFFVTQIRGGYYDN